MSAKRDATHLDLINSEPPPKRQKLSENQLNLKDCQNYLRCLLQFDRIAIKHREDIDNMDTFNRSMPRIDTLLKYYKILKQVLSGDKTIRFDQLFNAIQNIVNHVPMKYQKKAIEDCDVKEITLIFESYDGYITERDRPNWFKSLTEYNTLYLEQIQESAIFGQTNCTHCNGSGIYEPYRECTTCDGKGVGRFGRFICPDCDEGKITEECHVCNIWTRGFCVECDEDGEIEEECPRCNGNWNRMDCPHCRRTGNFVWGKMGKCWVCKGSGIGDNGDGTDDDDEEKSNDDVNDVNNDDNVNDEDDVKSSNNGNNLEEAMAIISEKVCMTFKQYRGEYKDKMERYELMIFRCNVRVQKKYKEKYSDVCIDEFIVMFTSYIESLAQKYVECDKKEKQKEEEINVSSENYQKTINKFIETMNENNCLKQKIMEQSNVIQKMENNMHKMEKELRQKIENQLREKIENELRQRMENELKQKMQNELRQKIEDQEQLYLVKMNALKQENKTLKDSMKTLKNVLIQKNAGNLRMMQELKELTIQKNKLQIISSALRSQMLEGHNPRKGMIQSSKCLDGIERTDTVKQWKIELNDDYDDIEIGQYKDDKITKSVLQKIKYFMKLNKNDQEYTNPMTTFNKLALNDIIYRFKIAMPHRVPSLVGQQGIRTKMDIPKGTVLCRYVGFEMTNAQWNKVFDYSNKELLNGMYLYKIDLDDKHGEVRSITIDPIEGGKQKLSALYINDCRKDIYAEEEELSKDDKKHRNCVFNVVLHKGWPTVFIVTTRNVSKDEELLTDYSMEYWDSIKHDNRWNDMIHEVRKMTQQNVIKNNKIHDVHKGIECHDLTSH